MSYKLEIKNWKKRSNLRQKIAKFAKSLKSLHKRLIVGLPMASQFQETVEMDLKQHDGKILIHFIGHAACLSAATVIPNKNRETIIKKILEIWTSVYGKPQKSLTDNGGEFANADFLKMAEQLRIDVKTTAVESAWSNEVAERQFCDRRHVR